MQNSEDLILFYDGDCVLCHGVVKRLLSLDKEGKLKYAPLQGSTADSFREQHIALPNNVSEIVLWDRGALYSGQKAVQQILILLGGGSKMLGTLMGGFPRFIKEWGYRLVADSRYRIWGKTESFCPVIPPELRNRFLD